MDDRTENLVAATQVFWPMGVCRYRSWCGRASWLAGDWLPGPSGVVICEWVTGSRRAARVQDCRPSWWRELVEWRVGKRRGCVRGRASSQASFVRLVVSSPLFLAAGMDGERADACGSGKK